MIPLFILAALAYGASTFAYGAAGRGEEGVAPLAPRIALSGAAALHFATIGAQCVHGDHPFRSIFLVSSFGVWVAVVAYLVISWRGRAMRALGAALAPLGLVGLTLSVVLGPQATGALPAAPNLLTAHVALASIGLAGFVLAAGVAGLYLAMDRRLRAKKFRPDAGGMSLSGLEQLHYWIMLFVTPVFTLAVVTGALLLLREDGAELFARRGVEMVAAGVAWVASLAVLVSRVAWNLRGRNAAWLTMLGLISVLVIVVAYGVRA